MANMLRSEMVTELQIRGWSRFTSTQLEKYLDWALQDIYGEGKFPRSTLTIAAITGSVLDILPFATISGGAAELVQMIKRVFVKYGGDVFELEPFEEGEFMAIGWVNTQVTNPVKAVKPDRYFVYDLNVFTYPKPSAAIDYHIHHLLREDTFSGAGDVTGLPERFDKAVLARAEYHCNRRAHDQEGMALADGEVRRFMLDEMGMAASEMEEKYERVVPWRG